MIHFDDMSLKDETLNFWITVFFGLWFVSFVTGVNRTDGVCMYVRVPINNIESINKMNSWMIV